MQLRRQTAAFRIACAAALCLVLTSGQAVAAPNASAPTTTQSVSVAVLHDSPSVTPDSTMHVTVRVTLAAPAEYLEVRLRMRKDSGRLLYQKTEIRADAAPGAHFVEYEYDLSELELEQGRYPLEIRVLATGSDATAAESRLLVTDPGEDPLPVAVVVNASAAPAVTTEGHFVTDPADDTRLRDDLFAVLQLAHNRRMPLSLALPPVLLEELGRIEGGFETTAGVSVPASSDVSVLAAALLDTLHSALSTGTVDIVDVPYALPDAGRLQEMSADEDFEMHWQRTDAVNAALLHTDAEPVVAYVGRTLTAGALDALEARGAGCVLAPPSAVRSDETTASPGCYQLPGSSLRVLVLDTQAAESAREGAEQFYDALFDRIGEGPVVMMLEIGSDPDGVAAVQRALDWIDQATWLRATSLEGMSHISTEGSVRLSPVTPEPSAYWTEVREGRDSGMAYGDAAGREDADAMALLRAVLVSESALFQGAYREARDTGEAVHDGRDFALAVREFVDAQFALIHLDAKDVALSGTTGDVPLTLINDTGKQLRLTLLAESESIHVDVSSQVHDIQPTQNFLTIPIDLGNTLSETVHVEVKAGEMTVTEATVNVTASYMDRLAIIGMVILVLGGLLVFIRRRALASDAATIDADTDEHRPRT